MSKRHIIVGVAGATLVCAAIVFVSVIHWPWQGNSTTLKSKSNDSSSDWGITYLPLNPTLVSQYNLSVDSGVLITEIREYGLANKAGIKQGDVIIRFNGVSIGKERSFLRTMRDYETNPVIEIEVVRGGTIERINLMNPNYQ